MTKAARLKAYRWGHIGEWAAVLWLRMRGYRLCARRLKTPLGEIDLLMTHKTALIAVEVKWRRDPQAWQNALAPQQIRRIARALQWAARQRGHQGDLQLEAIFLSPRRRPYHIRHLMLDDY